jgi:hypothetical protein
MSKSPWINPCRHHAAAGRVAGEVIAAVDCWLTFGHMHYFDAMDISEAVAHETTSAADGYPGDKVALWGCSLSTEMPGAVRTSRV